MKKYLKLDPKPSDLTMVRVIKARTGQLKGMSPFKARVKVNLLLKTIKLTGTP